MPFVVELVRRPQDEPSAFLRKARVKLDTGHVPGVDEWVVDRESERVLVHAGGGRAEPGEPRSRYWCALDEHGLYKLVTRDRSEERNKGASTLRREVELGRFADVLPGHADPGTRTLEWVAAALKAYEKALQAPYFQHVQLEVIDARTGEVL